jgi:hypothetical protein
MSSKNTWLWLTAAVALFAFIFLYEHYRPRPVTGPAYLLPELDAQTVRTLQIRPAGQADIRVERTNNGWRLVAPVAYPAKSTNVQKLLETLQLLTVPHRIPENDLRQNPKAAEEYGIEPPQLTLVFDSGPPILFGHRTSPGDQVFVRIPGREGVAVVDSSVLVLFPQNANDWRDPRLADTAGAPFDRIVVTNATKSQWSFMLQRDSTNRLWAMMFPLQVRADSEKVDDALQSLQKLRVHEFVSDDPKADLESYGLQSPTVTLALSQGSNSVLVLDFGKELTNSPGLIYARRRDQSAVVTLSTNGLAQWNASYDVFRDRHLVTMLGPIDSVHVTGQDEFTLQWQTNNTWRVASQNFPADQTLATHLVRTLSELQVASFEKDNVTDPLLSQYGLAKPARQFTISWAPSATATNAPTIIDFGVNTTNNQVFARRMGEVAVYRINPADFEALPSASWEMRERRIWNFDPTNVVRLTIQQNGQTLEIVRKGTSGWGIGTNSSGNINSSAIEDTVRDLGHLTAFAWVGHGADKLASFGFDAKGYQLSIELKDGDKRMFQLGGDTRLGSAYACVTLNGEPWIFEFPPDVLPSVVYSLMIHPSPP